MKLWVLVDQEHYAKYCELHAFSQTDTSFQKYLREIGTPSIQFESSRDSGFVKGVFRKEVPQGSCIRLWQTHEYIAVVHEKLFQVPHEKEDKSRRSNSCSIV